MAGLWNIKHFPLYSHTMLVVGPEHARTFGDEGWSKDDLKRHLLETVRVPYRTLLPDADNGEGTNLRFAQGAASPPPESSFQVPLARGAARGGGGRHRRPLLDGHPGLAGHQQRLHARSRWPSEYPLTGPGRVRYASGRL